MPSFAGFNPFKKEDFLDPLLEEEEEKEHHFVDCVSPGIIYHRFLAVSENPENV